MFISYFGGLKVFDCSFLLSLKAFRVLRALV